MTESQELSEHGRATALSHSFSEFFGAPADGLWRAPGRVNLISEHLDYNNGLVLPFAINRSAVLGIRLIPESNTSEVVSTWVDPATGNQAHDTFRMDRLAPGGVTGWASGLAGVAWALQQTTGAPVPAFQALVDSNVPVGSGLSSSHAVEVSLALALAELTGADVDRRDLARITQRAENDFIGAPTGIMDQSASLLSTAGHAILLNCRTLETEHIPLPLEQAGVRLMVVDTRVAHRNNDGGYAARRNACEESARLLGVETLGDVPTGTDLSELPEHLRPKARHVLNERARVQTAVNCLRAGDWAGLGHALNESHESLRDDYNVSCPELDLAVETMQKAGALGARMTGAGFGGSAIGLFCDADIPQAKTAVKEAFAHAKWVEPRLFTVLPGPGADRLR